MWIGITIFAALAQTARNAVQRHLAAEIGTLGATLVRFLYGLPFAIAWLGIVFASTSVAMPVVTMGFVAWSALGGATQVIGTALLLRTMHERNFAVGVAYSKTEVLQIAIFAWLVLDETISARTGLAIACGTVGVLLLSPPDPRHPLRSLVTNLASRSAVLGMGCGAFLACSGVALAAAARTLASGSFLLDAAATLVMSQFLQSAILGGWLGVRNPSVLRRTLEAWRPSLFAGFMGAAATAAWLSAFTLKSVTHVRTLGLIEMLFSYVVSRRVFRERIAPRELAAIGLLTFAVVLSATAG